MQGFGEFLVYWGSYELAARCVPGLRLSGTIPLFPLYACVAKTNLCSFAVCFSRRTLF